MNSMLISVLGVYLDIFYKHYYKIVQIGYETSIHKIHKGRRGIGQAKGHHIEFIVTIFGPKRGFGDVFRFNIKLMIFRLKSILEKDHAYYSWSNKSFIRDKGYLFFMVILFSSR